ncbi:MAG: DUF4445 domain-containing protein [Desulfobacterales bacterium]|nr:DUF4445 domain-containing protein [Desulfobacterales bacterium]
MPEIQILPMNLSVRTRKGETLRDALYRAGVELESPCNGKGLCGKCLVCVESPDHVAETPHKEITPEQAQQGIRLACQLVPAADMVVRVIGEYKKDEHRILEGDRDPTFSERNTGDAGAGRKYLSDTESLVKNTPAAVVKMSNGICRLHYAGQGSEELKNWPEKTVAKGLAIDLGTTTLVVTLIELPTGRELATTSSLNPQIRYGHDVISRIQKGSTPEGLAELSQCVREGLNHLIEQACQDSGADAMEVLDVVLGGNTTMLQLAASIDPEPLGQVPFTVALQGGRSYPARQFGLEINPAARVYVPPIVHAYVGADISAGLLVSRRFFEPGEAMFFVDVGTNGEMGLSANSEYLMTSTAAGPAFEGMGISAGMRARIGAVEGVETDGHARLDVHTIGDAPPQGICGSGIIDITAALLKLGVIDASGRMRRPDDTKGLAGTIASRLIEINKSPAFHLGGKVYFTQEDVRQVQLAKSAIRAAMEILLQESGMEAGSLERIVLAGGFGYSLRAPNLEAIGMLPPGTADKVYFAGNTCRIGCARMLRNAGYRQYLEEKMQSVRHVSIETRPDFMELYVESMEFPETKE